MYFLQEYRDLVFQVDTLPIGVEPDKDPLATVYHEDIIIADLLVVGVVAPVAELVGLDCEYGTLHKSSVVDAPAVRAVTIARVEGFVVYESRELCIDGVPDHDFFRVLVDPKAAWISGEHPFEARRTVPVVLDLATP